MLKIYLLKSHKKEEKIIFGSKARLNSICPLKIKLDKYLKNRETNFKKKIFFSSL